MTHRRLAVPLGVARLAVPLGVALLAALALAGCGRTGRPVAPEERAPQAVSDLRGVVRAGAIELTWSPPRRRVDSSRLRDPAVTRLYRFEDAGAGEPKPAMLAGGRIVGYTEIASIRLADPPAPLVQSGRIVFTDRQVAFGRRYTYVVVTEDAQGRLSPPSPRLTLTYIAAPEPPTLRAEPGERQARLAWGPPARLSDGTPVTAPLAYEILRGTTPAVLAPVTRTTPGQTSYVDANLENDRTYHYALRAVRIEGAASAISEPSATVAVTPRDMTPPSAPTDLVAIPSQGTVRLSWRPSPEPDVAAYIVYRADGAGSPQRIASVPVPGTTFVDRGVRAGTYRYSVTAQDSGARANESARSSEVTVAVP
jgi:hypothetical protein